MPLDTLLILLPVLAGCVTPLVALGMILRHRGKSLALRGVKMDGVEERLDELTRRLEEHAAEMTLLIEDRVRPRLDAPPSAGDDA